MIYRRRKDSHVWHFVPDCMMYPVIDYAEFKTVATNQPPYGRLCDECLKLKRGRRDDDTRSR